MFINDRYISKGVQQAIPLDLQILMWDCIDALQKQNIELDYLQIFTFIKKRIDDIFLQEIQHSQEMPKYIKTYRIFSNEPIDKKIYVIDNGGYSTMILPEEY